MGNVTEGSAGRDAFGNRRISLDNGGMFGLDDDALHDGGDRRESLRHSSSFREGKFREIWDFMTVPENYRTRQLLCRPANQITDPKPGKIIYVSDDPTSDVQSRLDRRIMVVLRNRPTSVTCLSFCQHHPEPADPADHWHVCAKSSSPEADENNGMTTLQVVLRPYGPIATSEFSPQPNTTINVQDMWNVETGVRVAMLGYVKPASMRELVKVVKELFLQSLDQAVPPTHIEEGRRTSQGESSGKSRSLPNGKGFVRLHSVKSK